MSYFQNAATSEKMKGRTSDSEQAPNHNQDQRTHVSKRSGIHGKLIQNIRKAKKMEVDIKEKTAVLIQMVCTFALLYITNTLANLRRLLMLCQLMKHTRHENKELVSSG